jgi:hypothetical protein
MPMTDATREKLSAAHQGKRHTPETRRKISAAKKGRPWSQARREKFERKRNAKHL